MLCRGDDRAHLQNAISLFPCFGNQSRSYSILRGPLPRNNKSQGKHTAVVLSVEHDKVRYLRNTLYYMISVRISLFALYSNISGYLIDFYAVSTHLEIRGNHFSPRMPTVPSARTSSAPELVYSLPTEHFPSGGRPRTSASAIAF